MSKITLTDLVNLQNETTAVNAINDNSAVIEAAFDNTISRDGTQPNQMQAQLDMNSNDILNLPAPTSNYSPIRLIDYAYLQSGGSVSVSPLPVGGTAGQVLTKDSSTNYDTSWQDSTASGPITGTGATVHQTSPTINTATLNSPTMVTPTLGAATATTVNKVAITQPATGSTITVDDGKTLRATNSLTLSGTDGTVQTFPNASGNVITTSTTNQITNAMLAQAPALTVKGNNTLSASNTQDLTISQFQAMLGLGGNSFIGNVNYSITTADSNVIAASALTAPRTWTLPKASTYPAGRQLSLFANAGVINGVNQLTIAPFAGDTVASSSSLLLTTSRDGIRLISDGSSDWKAILPDSRLVTTRFSPTSAGVNVSGAVDRTLHDKVYEEISVLDFGAVGNNAADNLTQFNAVAAYCAGKYVKIKVPAGNYLCSAAWVFDGNSNIIIEGDGQEISTIVFSGGVGATGGIQYGNINSGWDVMVAAGTTGTRPFFGVNDLSIKTNSNGSHNGITCFQPYSPSTDLTGFNFFNINIAPLDWSNAGQFFNNGIYVYNAWRGSIVNVSANQPINKYTGNGIFLDGLSPAVHIDKCVTQYWNKGVNIGNVQFTSFNGGTLTGTFLYGELIVGNTSGAQMRFCRPYFGGATVVGIGVAATPFTPGETIRGTVSGATLTGTAAVSVGQGNEGTYVSNSELIICNYAFVSDQPANTFVGTPAIGMWVQNSNLSANISNIYSRNTGQWMISGNIFFPLANNEIDVDMDGGNVAHIVDNQIWTGTYTGVIGVKVGATGYGEAIIANNYFAQKNVAIQMGAGMVNSPYPYNNFFESNVTNINNLSGIPATSNTITAKSAVANQWLNSVNSSGVFTSTQPSASNLSNGTTGSGAVVLANGASLGSTSATTFGVNSGTTSNSTIAAFAPSSGYGGNFTLTDVSAVTQGYLAYQGTTAPAGRANVVELGSVGRDITIRPNEVETVRFPTASAGQMTVGLAGTTAGKVALSGVTSGTTALQSASAASGTLTIPSATDTLIGKATTDTLTNKTYDTAGAGNSFSINGLAATSNTGTGAIVRASSPTLVTPSLGTPSNITLTNGTGLPTSGLGAQAAYTVVANATNVSASPTAVSIPALTQKVSPVSGDMIMISDSAASNALKFATVGSIASAGSVSSIAGNTGAFTLGQGLSNNVNSLQVDQTAWTSYTPTLAVGGGTLTSGTASGWYKLFGKTLYLTVRVDVTNIGTAVAFFSLSLPAGMTATRFASMAGNNPANGVSMTAYASGSNVLMFKYDNTGIGVANGQFGIATGVVEIT